MTNTKIQANDIRARWSRLNQANLAIVKSQDALSALVEEAYSLDKARADTEVTAWMVDRRF